MLECEVKVIRAQTISAQECLTFQPDYLVIGPGPGTPSQAFLSKDLLTLAPENLPILGICLGHQLIAEHFGGKVVCASAPMHGKVSAIHHQDQGVFKGLPQPFTATRYHSLIVEENFLPETLIITARSENEEIMGIQHRSLPIEGVQFHPESILTEKGMSIFQNFLHSKVRA